MRQVKVIGGQSTLLGASPHWFMPVSTQGYWRGMSLLFPMEKLFENYVTYNLHRNLSDCIVFVINPALVIEKRENSGALEFWWLFIND